MEKDSLMVDSMSEIEVERQEDFSFTDWKRKYSMAQVDIRKLKGDLHIERNRNEQMRAVLVRELGSGELVVDALKGKSTGWKGRSEEVVELRKKLKQLTANNSHNVAIVVDNKRTNELEASMESLRSDLAEIEVVKKALRARNQLLESAVTATRADIKLLVEKDRLNSEIIIDMRRRLNLT